MSSRSWYWTRRQCDQQERKKETRHGGKVRPTGRLMGQLERGAGRKRAEVGGSGAVGGFYAGKRKRGEVSENGQGNEFEMRLRWSLFGGGGEKW